LTPTTSIRYSDISVAGDPKLPVWAVAPGVPSAHIVRAALQAAAVIDAKGSRVTDARESYWRRATGGLFPAADMRRGEALLMDCGLLIDQAGVLIPTGDLRELLDGTVGDAVEVVTARAIEASAPEWLTADDGQPPRAFDALISDPLRREQLLLALGRRFDDSHRRLVGEIGEELVVSEARRELDAIAQHELSRRVRRVSLESDQLGYDVSAPRVGAGSRLMEVKSSTSAPSGNCGVHLTRNEAETGLLYPSDWVLVFCHVSDVESRHGEVVGWCTRKALGPLLPVDAPGGRWEQAWIEIPAALFTPGLPRASA
jgi:hypothetical protein